MNEDKMVVSVCIMTYNQEHCIRQTIEGALIQKCDFPIEIIIADDCSKDANRDICMEYQKRHPSLIKLLFHPINLGAVGNWVETFSQASGKYIAICEGDDYWTDPYKLQKQVDFMEANSDFSLVYHRVSILNDETKEITPEQFNTSDIANVYTIADLAKGNFIHTPSVLIRNKQVDYSKLLTSKAVGDYFLWMLCADKGKIKYLPDVMAMYRVSNTSTWELKDNEFKIHTWLNLLILLYKEFSENPVIRKELAHQMQSNYKRLYKLCIESNKLEILDPITQRLLICSNEFQEWWFAYMIHVKATRTYRFKYFFYLLKNNALVSIFLAKKCVY